MDAMKRKKLGLPRQLVYNNIEIEVDVLSSDKIPHVYDLVSNLQQNGIWVAIDEYPSESHLRSVVDKPTTCGVIIKTLKTNSTYAFMMAYESPICHDKQIADAAIFVTPKLHKNGLGSHCFYLLCELASRFGYMQCITDVIAGSPMTKILMKNNIPFVGRIPSSAYIKDRGFADTCIASIDLTRSYGHKKVKRTNTVAFPTAATISFPTSATTVQKNLAFQLPIKKPTEEQLFKNLNLPEVFLLDEKNYVLDFVTENDLKEVNEFVQIASRKQNVPAMEVNYNTSLPPVGPTACNYISVSNTHNLVAVICIIPSETYRSWHATDIHLYTDNKGSCPTGVLWELARDLARQKGYVIGVTYEYAADSEDTNQENSSKVLAAHIPLIPRGDYLNIWCEMLNKCISHSYSLNSRL